MRLQIAAKLSVLCCHLANVNEKLGGLARSTPVFTVRCSNESIVFSVLAKFLLFFFVNTINHEPLHVSQ